MGVRRICTSVGVLQYSMVWVTSRAASRPKCPVCKYLLVAPYVPKHSLVCKYKYATKYASRISFRYVCSAKIRPPRGRLDSHNIPTTKAEIEKTEGRAPFLDALPVKYNHGRLPVTGWYYSVRISANYPSLLPISLANSLLALDMPKPKWTNGIRRLGEFWILNWLMVDDLMYVL